MMSRGRREMALWEAVWLSQGKRCATCNQEVALRDTAKSSYSFKIVCRDCYDNPPVTVIIDELKEV